MLERLLWCMLFTSWAIAGVSHAERLDYGSRSLPIKQTISPKVTIPGTNYELSFGQPRTQPGGVLPSPALMKAIATWLAINFDLPTIDSHPAVKLVSNGEITTFRYTGLLSNTPQDVASVPAGQREVVAAYDAIANTIYLPKGWSGSTPAELSILIHEMVHHLQKLARIKHECTQASEELAYAAQEKWLGLFGRNLMTDFDIDPFTLLVSTRCSY